MFRQWTKGSREAESEEALWTEILTLFLPDICTLVQTYSILDGLIINVNQTTSRYVPISSVTMAEKKSKHVPKQRGDKCAITLTLVKTLSGDVTYTSKTSRSLPTTEFPEGFLLGFKKSHWSNEEETLRLLKVISPWCH